MSKRAVDAVFEAMFLLTDIRVMLRETAPGHVLTPDRRGEVIALLDGLEEKVEILRTELAP